jgi:hypothetical protein
MGVLVTGIYLSVGISGIITLYKLAPRRIQHDINEFIERIGG